ncbi:uncharacterized protein LOC128389593 [Panonychus citri]|uniref:uncharacterized protein LOC128389593 n=1 Tax=Panonychus citri TaxID=50023 RepID=UPI00230732C3|nr:uncharacterized protein LOC128389593 [Panonychus citri]
MKLYIVTVNLIVLLSLFLIVTNVHSKSPEPSKGDDQFTDLLKVKVDEISDTYVIINVTGSSDFQDYPFDRLNLTGKIDKVENKKHIWIPVDEGFQFNVTKSIHNNKTQSISNLIKIDNLQPNQLYRFKIVGKYGNVIYVDTEPEHVDITTKPLAPKGTVNKQISLSLEGTNVKTYFVQVDKVVKRNRLETVINSTISSSHSDYITLDNLKSGTRYSIKLWYLDNNKKTSAIKTIDYKA